MTRWKKEIAKLMGLPPEVALYKLRMAKEWRVRMIYNKCGPTATGYNLNYFSRQELTKAFNQDAIRQLRLTLERCA